MSASPRIHASLNHPVVRHLLAAAGRARGTMRCTRGGERHPGAALRRTRAGARRTPPVLRLTPVVVLLAALALAVAFVAPASAQEHVWSRSFGGIFSDSAFDIVADADGNVYVTGSFDGTVDFGSGPVASQGMADIFLVKCDPLGNILWSKTFGSTQSDQGFAVGVDAAGNVYVAGHFHRTVDFGGGPITSYGWANPPGYDTYDVFRAKYDADGNHIWSYGMGGEADDVAQDISVDAAGGFALTGYVGWTAGPGYFYDIYVAKFDAAGTQLWNLPFGSSGDDKGLGVAMDGNGTVIMTGSFEGTVNFGGGNLAASGLADIVLAKYSAAGAHQWSQRYGHVLMDEGMDVAVDVYGNIALTGYFNSQMTFGSGLLTSAGGSDAFLAGFNSAGTNTWSHRFGNTNEDAGRSVVFDANQNVMTAGTFRISADFGGGVLTSAGNTDIYLATFDGTGTHLLSRRFGNTNNDYALICTRNLGETWMTGNFSGTADYGGGPLVSNGAGDVFVARIGEPLAEPGVITISDVPADQGGWVSIDFVRSYYDDLGAADPVARYEVYMALPPPFAPTLEATVPATQQGTYTTVVRTWRDVLPVSYRVVAITAASTVYGAPWADGISIDNLAPAAPANFVATPPNMLTWNAAPEPDFDHFSLYGSSSPVFDGAASGALGASGAGASAAGPDAGAGAAALPNAVLITNTTGTSYDAGSETYAYFHLTASDDAGNQGPASTVANPATGVGNTPGVGTLSLLVHPNPFNPSTTISYFVPSDGPVSLTVHDVTGRVVDAIFTNAYRDAGEHRVTYRPRAASGVYFARLVAGGETSVRRIVLLK